MWCTDTHENCKDGIPNYRNASVVLKDLDVKFERMNLEDYSDIGKEVGVDKLPYIRFYP